jgi:hypothetical protein
MNYKLLADSKNGLTQYFLYRESGEEDLEARANCSAAPTQLALCLQLSTI